MISHGTTVPSATASTRSAGASITRRARRAVGTIALTSRITLRTWADVYAVDVGSGPQRGASSVEYSRCRPRSQNGIWSTRPPGRCSQMYSDP